MPRINLSYPVNIAIKLRNAQRDITTPSRIRAQIVEALFLKRIIIALDKVGRLYIIFRGSRRLESAIQSEDLAPNNVKRATFLDGRSGFDVPGDFFLTNKLKLDGAIISIGKVPSIEGIIALTSTSAYLVTFAFQAANVVEVNRCELLLTSASNPIVKIISLPNESCPDLSEVFLLNKCGTLFRLINIDHDAVVVDARIPKLEEMSLIRPVITAIDLGKQLYCLPVDGGNLICYEKISSCDEGSGLPPPNLLGYYFLCPIPARLLPLDSSVQLISSTQFDSFSGNYEGFVLLLANRKMCLGEVDYGLIKWSHLILPFEKEICFITASKGVAAFVTNNGECWICPDFESKKVIEIAYPEGLRGNIAKVVLDSNKKCSALVITKSGNLHHIETIL
jgi:hypothetical protein